MRRNNILFLCTILLLMGAIGLLIIVDPQEEKLQEERKVQVQEAPVKVSGDPLPIFDASLEEDIAIGVQAPALAGRNALDETVLIAPDEDPPTLLVFVSHWCDQCAQQIEHIAQWAQVNTQPDGVRIVAVSTAPDQTKAHWPPSTWLAELEWPFQTLYDDPSQSARHAYGVDGFPHFVLIGQEGSVLARETGLLDDAQLEALFELAREDVVDPDEQVSTDAVEQLDPGESSDAPAPQVSTCEQLQQQDPAQVRDALAGTGRARECILENAAG